MVVYKIYAMRDRSVAVASYGGLAGGMVTTHPQGSLGSDDLICGQIVWVPCLRERQSAHLLEPEISLLWG
jgi:hypothetical protein